MWGAAPIVIDDNTVLTPNILGQYELQKASYRDSLTLFRQPVATLRLFLIATSKFLTLTCKTILSHPLFLYFVFPLISAWAVLRQFDGPHTVYVDKAQFWVEFVVWWVGLGILSSIGLGSGYNPGFCLYFRTSLKLAWQRSRATRSTLRRIQTCGSGHQTACFSVPRP
jgi:hypothetical protein